MNKLRSAECGHHENRWFFNFSFFGSKVSEPWRFSREIIYRQFFSISIFQFCYPHWFSSRSEIFFPSTLFSRLLCSQWVFLGGAIASPRVLGSSKREERGHPTPEFQTQLRRIITAAGSTTGPNVGVLTSDVRDRSARWLRVPFSMHPTTPLSPSLPWREERPIRTLCLDTLSEL